MSQILDFSILPANAGITKKYTWGTSTIYNTVLQDCFNDDELLAIISKFSGIPKEALSPAKTAVIDSLKTKSATK